MTALKLEAGKDYRTEDGSRVTLYAHDNTAWPFIDGPNKYWPRTEFWSSGEGDSAHARAGQCYGDKYGGAGPGKNIVAEWTDTSLADTDSDTGENHRAPPRDRLADALEKISASLETIALHLAPRSPPTNLQAPGSVYPATIPASAFTTEAQPDADGWIAWHGGECPVPFGTLVDVRFRSGSVQTDCEPTDFNAGSNTSPTAPGVAGSWWYDRGTTFDIVAYKIHKPA